MKNMVFAKSTKLSRRKFIVGSAAVAGGGLALGLNVPFDLAYELREIKELIEKTTCYLDGDKSAVRVIGVSDD